MARYETFTFRITEEERQLLRSVAERVNRSQADTIRWLVQIADIQLDSLSQNPIQPAKPKEKAPA